MKSFYREIMRLWHAALQRRSQKIQYKVPPHSMYSSLQPGVFGGCTIRAHRETQVRPFQDAFEAG